MRPEHDDRVETLFAAAREKPPAERAAFLECLSDLDPELRAEVESRLAGGGDDVPEREPPETGGEQTGPTIVRPAERQGTSETHVGPYRLLREIGRGGMGTVHLAVRDDDEYKKRVAVKRLRKGMDSDDVVRRFRSERQILAAVEHSCIAKLYDGGTTETGSPYFVMELVEGRPLDAYGDTHRLTVPERLELFRKVCAAVQFAHQNLVVHRDLKPGNILVTESGEPKLLDFGIAKLLNPELASTTVDPTRFQVGLMTPAYASPEQVRGEPITTATDVYSLGVILYELLTGHRPYQIPTSALQELTRVVCEVEPTRPSQMVVREGHATESSGKTPPTPETVSRARSDSADKLRKRLSGDLDNVVMMALRKEPRRRYASVEQLSEDIRRHLEGRPIRARKSTVGYRASKFVQRHRVGLAAAVLVVVSLVGFTAVTVQARGRAEREAAKAATINDFMRKTLTAANPFRGGAREVTVADALGRAVQELDSSFSTEPEVRAALQRTIGTTYRELGRFEEAERLLVSALETRRRLFGEDHPDVAQSLTDLADVNEAQGDSVEADRLYREALRRHRALHDQRAEARDLDGLASTFIDRGDYDEAERLQREAIRLHQELGGEPRREYSDVLNNLALTRDHQGDPEESQALYRRALAIDRELLGDEHPDVATVLSNLGLLLLETRGREAAEPYVREALALRRKVLGDHPDTALSLTFVGEVLRSQGDAAGAEELYREALEMQRRFLGRDHTDTCATLITLGVLLKNAGRLDEAESLMREAIAIWRNEVSDDHPGLAVGMVSLARVLAEKGETAEAEELFEHACASLDEAHGASHWRSADCHVHQGILLLKQARYAEAEASLLPAHAVMHDVIGPEHLWTRRARTHLASLYEAWGKPDEAARFRAVASDAEDSGR